MVFYLIVLIFGLSNSLDAQTYNRKEWHPRWTDEDHNCRNTRNEILLERSLVPVEFANNKKCSVLKGKWKDFYYPAVHYNAKDVDIDHLVPLFEAHKSGGAAWSRDKKRKFANDPENLVITSQKANRQKGANTLKTWLPVNLSYACKYYKQWMYIKKKYELSISPEELAAVDVSKCE